MVRHRSTTALSDTAARRHFLARARLLLLLQRGIERLDRLVHETLGLRGGEPRRISASIVVGMRVSRLLAVRIRVRRVSLLVRSVSLGGDGRSLERVAEERGMVRCVEQVDERDEADQSWH